MRYKARQPDKTPALVLTVFRKLILLMLIGFLGVFMYNKARDFLCHAAIFEVKEVVKSPALSFIESKHLQSLIGRNMFRIDLEQVQQQLQSQYPHIDRLRIVREFPNRLYLVARTRNPVAWARIGQGSFLFDRSAIVLPASHPIARFPEIRGVEQDRQVVVGKPFASKRVRIALEIITDVKADSYLNSYTTQSVDVTHLSQISLVLKSPGLPLMQDQLSVIMDGDHIPKKVRTLGILLSQGNLDPQQIKYIDLRFKEPILGKR